MFYSKYFMLLLLCLPAAMQVKGQSEVVWNPPVVVSHTNLPVTAPRIDFLPNGTPIVAWGTSSNNSQVWCATMQNGSFTSPVPIVQSPNQPILFGFGGYDMAVFDQQVHIVFEQLQSGLWYTSSADGGQSFLPPVLVQGPVTGGYATIASIATDDMGNPIISYIRDKNGAVYEIRKSTNGGLSFEDPVVGNAPAPGGKVCECCSSDMMVSGDSVWLIFRNNNQDLRDIWVSRSTDHAASFDLATDVDDTDWYISSCPISGPRMTRSGDSLATVWMSQASGFSKVYASTLHAGEMSAGAQVSFPTTSGNLVNQTFPDIAASGDTIGVVFQEKGKEVVFFHSVNGISHFEQPETRFAVTNHTLQWPTIAIQNGVFHLVYTDAAADNIYYQTGTITATNKTVSPIDMPLSVFPNPAYNGQFQIVGDNASLGMVRVFNQLGQSVYHWEGMSDRIQVVLRNPAPGPYHLHMQIGQTFYYHTVVVH